MANPSEPPGVADLRRAAERLDDLAETAELMGDAAGAQRLKSAAWNRREEAMALLDHEI